MDQLLNPDRRLVLFYRVTDDEAFLNCLASTYNIHSINTICLHIRRFFSSRPQCDDTLVICYQVI